MEKIVGEKIIKQSIYTLDKLVLEFVIRTEDAQRLMDKLGYMVNVTSRTNSKRSVCRYNYYIDLDDKNSFYMGFEPNWKAFDSHVKYGRVEFNPAKVSEDIQFQSLYGELLSYVATGCINPVRFDLAIDIPVSRDKVHMLKDQRTYEEYSNSSLDRTQYLGKRNTHGRVKIYNKALELKLENIDLTRLELTIDYQERNLDQVNKLVPGMYIMDSFQFPLGVEGTEKVILFAVMSDITMIKELGRKMRKKIEGYLEHTLLKLELDSVKYNYVLEHVNTFVK